MVDSTMNERFYREGRRSTGDDFTSILKQFHKDFKSRLDQVLIYMKNENERQIQEYKRRTLGSVTNEISNVTNNITTIQNRQQARVFKSVVSDLSTTSNQQVAKELKTINKTLEETSKKELSKSKSLFKNSIIQARVIEGIFNLAKGFFLSGPSDTDRIVNAINNVEAAIRNEEKILLDERSRFQKFAESLPEGNIFKKIAEFIPSTGTIGERVSGLGLRLGKFGFEKAKETGLLASELVSAILSLFGTEIETSPNVKKKAKKAGNKTFDILMEGFDSAIKYAFGSKFAKTKTAVIGSFVAFGTGLDTAIVSAILNPIKTLKLAIKTMKVTMRTIVDRPLLQGIAMVTASFGPIAGLVSTVLIPFAKLLRPLFIDIKDLKEGFSGFGKSIKRFGKSFKQGLKNFSDTVVGFSTSFVKKVGDFGTALGDAGSSMLKTFKKKMGKSFIKAGFILGGMGAKMLGIMGTIMAVGAAALPYIIGGLIIAAAIGIGYYVYKNWDEVKALWHEYIITPIVDFMFVVTDKMKEVGNWISEKWNSYIVTPLTNMVNSITEALSNIKESITNAISGFFSSIIKGAETVIRMLPFGDTVADALFGSQQATDTTMTNRGKIEIQKEFQRTQINDENKLALEKLNKTLNELNKNMKNQTPPSPPPTTNVEDVATYLVTQ